MDRSKVPILGGASILHEKSSAARSDPVISIGALPPGSEVSHRPGVLGLMPHIAFDACSRRAPRSGVRPACLQCSRERWRLVDGGRFQRVDVGIPGFDCI